MSGTVHIIGAGLAGLSAALRLTQAGRKVVLHEAAPFPGGRCRTFHDPRLERDVDNGNHLVLSGNRHARAYMEAVPGPHPMQMAEAAFPFVDLADGQRWTLTLDRAPLPFWVFAPGRRVAGTRLGEYLGAAGLALAGPDRTVAEAVRGRGTLWQRFWEPLSWAVLNTTPERGQARLLWRVLKETFLRGREHARPMFAPRGLGRALVEPHAAWLAGQGQDLRCGHALTQVETEGERATLLRFQEGEAIPLGAGDRVVLALPPTRLSAVASWVHPPDDGESILNAHFTLPDPPPGLPPFLGLVGATTHWIFVKGDVISLTVSAAGRLGQMDRAPEALMAELWAEVQRALGISRPYQAARVNKERRATFDQSPAGVARRPTARTPFTNLFLAGDATDTGLPATIEGAIRSGETAARLAA